MSDSRRPIPPNPPRWQPNQDPASIHVPGLDTGAPVLDQIEQIEQLITIKLQNIDENFSKIHNLLANKLLPAVKRYAVGTEPVREAAKFWTSFYEQAAQIHIPTYDDYSSVNEQHSRTEQEEHETISQSDSHSIPSHSRSDEPSMASTESSFMPGQAAFSSTPATSRGHRVTHDSIHSQGSDDPSWTASIESPLVRLDRELQDFSRQDYEGQGHSLSTKLPSLRYDEPVDAQQERSIQTRPDKGKAKEQAEPLLRNVLRQNLYSTSDISSPGGGASAVSSLKLRGKPKTPIPKSLNPYLPPNTDPADWSGVVDLADPPPLATPQRFGKPSSRRHPAIPIRPSEDDSFDGLPPGMSPPVMMSPARPPRSSAELGLLKLGKTPTKEAAARITRDLVFDIQKRSGEQGRQIYGYGKSGTESSMSTVPTPPSLSRYSRHGMDSGDSTSLDQSLESMMRRVGLNVPPSTGTASTPGLRLRSAASASAYGSEPASVVGPPEPETPVHAQAHTDFDSDSDSLDEVHNTAHPSAAFLMASQGRRGSSDDSFGSSNHSGDSLTEEDANLGLAPVHPFARGMEAVGFDDDDTFDDDGFEGNGVGGTQEETLFGLPVQRSRAQPQPLLRTGEGVRQDKGSQLRMLGEDLLQDTIGIGAQIAKTGRVEESPTPASWAGGSRA